MSDSMNSILICKSIHKGNTREVAEAISEVLDCEVKDPGEVSNQDVEEYDLIGFASGIYFRDFHKSIRNLVEDLDGKGTPCFMISTSGFPSIPLLHNYEKRMKKRLEENGFEVLDSFTCRGHDEYGPFKLIGGMYKNRPSEKDLERAREFAEEIIQQMNGKEDLEYEVKHLKERYVKQVLEIADNELGKDYLEEEELEKALDSNNDFYSLIAVGKSEEVLGYLNFEIQDKEAVDDYLKIPREEYPFTLKDFERVGAIKTGSVKKDYQGRGIGTELNNEVISELQEKKINIVYTIGWIKNGKAAISGIMDRMGFEKVKELNDYWKEESLKQGYCCSACGEPPCNCSAALFVKKI